MTDWIVVGVIGGLAVLVLGWAAAAAVGWLRPRPLPAPVSSVTPLVVPVGRPLAPDDLDGLRFDSGLRGYDPAPVDAHLEAWATWLRDPAGAPAPDAPAVRFREVLRGYRMDQVDAVLDRLAAEQERA